MKLKDLEIFQKPQNIKLNGSNLESLAYTLVQLYQKEKRLIPIVLPTLYEAQLLQSLLLDYLDEEDISLFLYDEVLRVDALGTSREMMYERLLSLQRIYQNIPGIVVFNSISLIRPVMAKEEYASLNRLYKKGDRFGRSDFLSFVQRAGYSRMSRVEHPGEFSLRGMIVDFFSPGSDKPVRIEIDGNSIDDIRSFNPSTELSEESLSTAFIGPATDLIYSVEDKEKIIEGLNKGIEKFPSFDATYQKIKRLIDSIDHDQTLSVPYRLFSYFGEFKPVGNADICFYAYHYEEIISFLKKSYSEEREYFDELVSGGAALAKEGLYLDSNSLNFDFQRIEENCDPLITSVPYVFQSIVELSSVIQQILGDGYSIFLFQSLERRGNLVNYLREENIFYSEYPNIGQVTLVDGSLSGGFCFTEKKTIFLGSKEIYGLNHRNGKFLTRFKEAKIIHKYDDLVSGDYVVHELHGIGRFEGVVTRNDLEYLSVAYRNNDRLLIPLVQFKLIKKYAGREGYAPSLDKLGGSTWLRRKSQIRSRISFLTDQLLEISGRRKLEKGFSFAEYPESEDLFAGAFPFELTLSQKNAWEEIKKDMVNIQPMDRLLSGDVGFGKTELAFRAAYKAILSHKQAALLCPTTVLCRQHYEVAVQRFKGFGIHVACFSRFVPLSLQKKNIERIKSGSIDLVIGTHRLLSPEIQFKDLGLLIVDEEQRFGVAQKEKFKAIGGNIDVLTLTATPIPRTLQMSMLGVRDLSNLDEPPLNRLPIKTYVTVFNKGLVKEAISLELGRHGQVYYLHNRVKTLYSKAKEIQEMFPNASVGVVHGQMTSSSISEIMNAFYDCNIDILICTSIIETGLDVANVNTMIVEDADRFGLAQLYQIKGRVGRSDRLAYAYFFYNAQKSINEDAKKRLKALKEFTELGSGYNIAKQDLNLRGAGDILGAEQAGFMDTIGFDSYQALLDEVIAQKKIAEKGNELAINGGLGRVLSFSIDSHVPGDYAEEASRITIYRELANITTEDELFSFSKKLRDVYGPYPLEVFNLINKRSIEIKLNRHYVKDFKEDLGFYTLVLSKDAFKHNASFLVFEKELDEYKDFIRITYKGDCLTFKIYKTKDYLDILLAVMNTVENVINAN